jgi:hypothetical protein
VSRKPDAICFHCGTTLDKCELKYVTYMNMAEEERNTFRENYIARMSLYQNKVNDLYRENKK